MNYQEIINAIEMTKHEHATAVKAATETRKHFKRHGHYCEEIAETVCAREQALWDALDILHGRLSTEAAA